MFSDSCDLSPETCNLPYPPMTSTDWAWFAGLAVIVIAIMLWNRFGPQEPTKTIAELNAEARSRGFASRDEEVEFWDSQR